MSAFTGLDVGVLVLYLAATTAWGAWLGRNQRGGTDHAKKRGGEPVSSWMQQGRRMQTAHPARTTSSAGPTATRLHSNRCFRSTSPRGASAGSKNPRAQRKNHTVLCEFVTHDTSMIFTSRTAPSCQGGYRHVGAGIEGLPFPFAAMLGHAQKRVSFGGTGLTLAGDADGGSPVPLTKMPISH